MTPVCPFVKVARPDEASSKKVGDNQNKHQSGQEGKAKQESGESATISPKCPFGYDSQSFKLGPFSCMICQALLFESSKCVPCSHVYCKACISRFKDCPLCGADIEKIEADTNLQTVVDRFIEGHARIKRSQVNTDQEEAVGEKKTVIYEDVSLDRGAFLVQQAMRAFRAHNVESAKSRLSLCAEDIREQLERMGSTSELCSQLGAVLGMLGDCWELSCRNRAWGWRIPPRIANRRFFLRSATETRPDLVRDAFPTEMEAYLLRRFIKQCAWLIVVIQSLLIIASRKHYTVDIVVAWYTVNLVVSFINYKLPELPDRTGGPALLLPLTKESRTKEENHKLLNGNSGDPVDRRLRTPVNGKILENGNTVHVDTMMNGV